MIALLYISCFFHCISNSSLGCSISSGRCIFCFCWYSISRGRNYLCSKWFILFVYLVDGGIINCVSCVGTKLWFGFFIWASICVFTVLYSFGRDNESLSFCNSYFCPRHFSPTISFSDGTLPCFYQSFYLHAPNSMLVCLEIWKLSPH